SIQDDPALLAHGVCLALAARVSFRQEASPDLPELPLASAEREKLIGSKNAEFAVLGFFGRSRASGNWGPHPVFRIYARGLMKSEYTPERIRTDPTMLRKFPPKPLGGLDDPSLVWGAHERLFDFTQQCIRNEDAWRRSGMTDDAKWMRGVLEQLLRIRLDARMRSFLDAQPERRT